MIVGGLWCCVFRCARLLVVRLTEEQLELEGDDFDFLLYELESSFWVDFSESDFFGLNTVGDLFDIVVRDLAGFESPRCLTSLAFYRLRRSLIDLSGLDRQSIQPTTSLRNLLPPKLRRTWWHVIETELRLRVPHLRLGPAAVVAYSAIFGLAILAFVVVAARFVPWEVAAIVQLGTPLLIWLLLKGAARLPREFPADTFGELVRILVRLNQGKLAQEAGGSTANQAWTAFKELLSMETGVPAAAISREMRLVHHPQRS